jgi:hypothetical protein
MSIIGNLFRRWQFPYSYMGENSDSPVYFVFLQFGGMAKKQPEEYVMYYENGSVHLNASNILHYSGHSFNVFTMAYEKFDQLISDACIKYISKADHILANQSASYLSRDCSVVKYSIYSKAKGIYITRKTTLFDYQAGRLFQNAIQYLDCTLNRPG